MSTETPPAISHPAPHRHQVRFAALLYGLGAAPLAWAVQSAAGYALSSYSCYPADLPRTTPLLTHAGMLMLLLNIAALATGISALVVAWRSWNTTRRERGGSTATLLQAGEGRTRFLAMCGVLTSCGFVLATLFTSTALLLAPLCR